MTTPDSEPIHEGEPGPDLEPDEREPDELHEDEPLEPDEPDEQRSSPQSEWATPAGLKRLERENTRHENRLAELIGGDWAQFEACDNCGGVGFHPQGEGQTPDLVDAAGVEQCTACNGHGRQRYPTQVEGQRFQVCITCAGAGWVREQTPAPVEAAAPAAPVPNGGPVAPAGYILVPVAPEYGAPAQPPPLAPPVAPVYPA